MAGGTRAWAAAGFELFTGVNVPSKAFGELVEHRCGTPHIAAAELKRRLDAGEEILIVDSRPIGEFRNMSIPGAFDCPGAELVYRVPDQLRSPDSLVVVNCAGRTRSIIGAQSLRNAGLANPVMALENGTMGWELAGLELARGRDEALPPPSPEGLAKARALADDVAERFGIAAHRRCGAGPLRGRGGGAHALPVRRAQPGGIRRGPSRRRALGAGRPAGAGDRRLYGDPQRPHRADRR